MKAKNILFLLVLMLPLSGFSVEGMWIPSMIHKNIADMQAMGLNLSAGDLYDENGPSLKDAIVRFGRGCTGSFISAQGLVLTNHHCGYGQIQAHSSVENDYLKNGFWAESREQELPNPGLTITILVRMEDVTSRVLENVRDNMTQQERNEAIREATRRIVAQAREGGRYEAQVSPFYYGNEFFLFVNQVFRDVRLVGAPPSSIGKYGGDVDNWVWPRHSGDFALFRVYADDDNQPAAYSKENKPFRPAHFLPVSGKTPEKHDFTMVYGYPGRTNRYLASQAVSFLVEKDNPLGIDLRTRILAIYEEEMRQSDQVRIQYASKHASLSNAWKRWKGEIHGLQRLDAVSIKRDFEDRFAAWASSGVASDAYAGLIPAFDEVYRELAPLRFSSRLYAEAGRNIEVVRFALQFEELVRMASDRKAKDEDIASLVNRLKTQARAHFRNYHAPIDRKVAEEMLARYLELAEPGWVPSVISEIASKHGGNTAAFAARMFDQSILVSEEKTLAFLDGFRRRDARTLQRDPAYLLATGLDAFQRQRVSGPEGQINSRLDSLYRLYVAGMRKMQPDVHFFPDANGTLRITYGRVEGSFPRDAVEYLHHTTGNGILEKAAQSDMIEDYIISPRLESLLSQREFGDYAHNGELVVNFVGSNHTTGGNSGSPVLDANGYLIGLNFDRSWESTMSDVMFDPEQCRNISVNAQYMLWVVHHYAGMKYLIEEMDVRK